MKHYRTVAEYDPARGCVLSPGIFDGFHLGHRKIVDTALARAAELDLPSLAMTFHPHPRRLLRSDGPDLIMSVDHRLQCLERSGVDGVMLLEFTREFAAMSAEEFLRRVASEGLGCRAIVTGRDAVMGSDRRTGEDLARIARGLGIALSTVEHVELNGERVSSSRVRSAISAGDLELAEALLGRRVSVLGSVVHGSAIGRELGFPTANLDVDHEVHPPLGVYACWAEYNGERLMSAANVGFNPTVAAPGEAPRELLVEAHILSPGVGDIYGERMELHFVKMLREERTFDSREALASQIALDVRHARAVLEEDGGR